MFSTRIFEPCASLGTMCQRGLENILDVTGVHTFGSYPGGRLSDDEGLRSVESHLAMSIRDLEGVGDQRLRTVFLELIVDPFTGTEVRDMVGGVSAAAGQTYRGSEVHHGYRTTTRSS